MRALFTKLNQESLNLTVPSDNHWIVTGPYIMVLGPPSKALGYTRSPDPPDSKHPYMMWANTPYEHAMIPVQ
jgi:hypothetical protein